MASKSSRGRSAQMSSPRGRGIRTTANIYTHQPMLPLGLPPLTMIEDRRTYHPKGETRPARSFLNPNHTLVARTPTAQMLRQHPTLVSPGVAFQAPRDVLVCVRRKTREQVLHALRKTGKRGQKSPRRSFFSDVSCK